MLELRGLRKSFGDEVVLDGIDLSVASGEVLVVLGPSGCGKSTLLRCAVGLEPLDSGEVLVDGNLISATARDASLRQRVGMVFQSYDLFPNRTVLGNVTLSPMVVQHRSRSDAEEQAQSLLDRVGLWDKRDSYPSTLSGGQRQRVAICRALAMRPEVLLLDEVTAALDPEMVREVLDVVIDLADGGLTMMIVTHEMRFAEAVADRVVMLDQGHIAETSDDPPAFFRDPATPRARAFLSTFDYRRRSGRASGSLTKE
jgi:polar amino acid transport system ATP-binding protein